VSVPVIVGLAAALLAAAPLVWSALALKRDRPARRARLATRFARMAGLTMLPDAADWVGSRVRSRFLTKITLLGPAVPVLAFVAIYLNARSWGRADQPMYVVPAILLAVTALVAAASVVAHLEERRSAERSGEPIADADQSRELRTLIPPLITWLSRCAPAVPLVAAVVIAIHGYPASDLRIWGLAVLGAASAAITAVAEKAELRIIRGPRLGSTRAELAFDDAFQAQTLLGIAKLPAVTPLLGTTLICLPASSGPVDFVAAAASLLSSAAGFGTFFILSMPWAGRYFRRNLPLPMPTAA
jgi:hypothetical protein